jgi:hypothetical protein
MVQGDPKNPNDNKCGNKNTGYILMTNSLMFSICQRDWRKTFTSSSPDRKTILDLIRKFERTGSVLRAEGSGRPRTATTTAMKEVIVESLKETPQTSSRRLSSELGVSHQSILRIMRELNYRPFHPQLVQALQDGDEDRRLEFAELFMEMLYDDHSLLDRIIWSDEAIFKLNGHINKHNCIYWADTNPHVTITQEMNLPGVMVWCGMWSNGIIGPFFFDTNVNAHSYLNLLQEKFWPEIEQRDTAQHLYFQHDGAPPHYAMIVRQWLDKKFPQRWLGRRGPIDWPPRSPDLTPPDFFLWGLLKDRVYGKKPQTIEDLKQEITAAVHDIPKELCNKVCHSVPDRLCKCIEHNGSHIEPFLKLQSKNHHH